MEAVSPDHSIRDPDEFPPPYPETTALSRRLQRVL